MRRIALWIGLLGSPAAADTIDHPTPQRPRLRGDATATGAITLDVGFPAHTYSATRSGFVRVALRTANTHAEDNRGRRWRPYLRILSAPSAVRRGEGWSTNAGALVIRIATGDELTIIATLAENVVKGGASAEASYVLSTVEIAP